MGLREINHLMLKDCEVEGDSAVVISWGTRNCLGSWELAPFVYEIKDVVFLLFISLVHIDRSQNKLVDKLANWGG